ncbi:hypothetical protein [Rhodovulum steppense]|uniref:Uncharacterized protein n=1 Tax=Rhodovulum steppense TaxID=540251 RepID=A0A4R1YX02_9RHOB|nr:hypothetical protein [Rhodovulum steppense]TCM85729.1 hypothetical protein EV216_10629 [Rhodovulum steppense]
MTCNPTRPSPFQMAANPFLFSNWMVEQQFQAFRMMTDIMIRTNPWFMLLRARGIDPLTADGALGEGDAPTDIDLEAGGAEAEARADPPAPPPAETSAPPAAVARITPAAPAKAKPARPRAATSPRKPATGADPSRSRARRQPAPPPRLPVEPGGPEGGGE